ncbi:MAG: type II toxin-antitoxin system VapC family toxin [Nitrospirae bacterium]|nr:type II toxin-antitoxin system VapC family toxin [Nitrospirota bacterium]
MILYLGTSSLVKFYVEEKYSDILRQWVNLAEIVATCRLSYTEVISALDSRLKAHDISKNDYDLIVKQFSHDWLHFAIIDFDEREASNLVKKHGLRRFDAIHLSAAKLIQKERKDITIFFSSAVKKLCRAATSEGLHVLNYS